jgi:hypothetical protein
VPAARGRAVARPRRRGRRDEARAMTRPRSWSSCPPTMPAARCA